MRSKWSVMSSSDIPNTSAVSARPLWGVWVGAQSSSLPSMKRAVQFCGSNGAWARNGYM